MYAKRTVAGLRHLSGGGRLERKNGAATSHKYSTEKVTCCVRLSNMRCSHRMGWRGRGKQQILTILTNKKMEVPIEMRL